MDWYFLSSEAVFLLWPWSFEARFFLPGAAFAAVYGWRGIQAVRRISTWKPRPTGAVGLVVSIPLGMHSSLSALGLGSGGELTGVRQVVLSALGWLLLAVASAWMWWQGRPPFSDRPPVLRGPWIDEARPRASTVGAVLLSVLVVVGVSQEIHLGWQNTHLAIDDLNPPDVEGAKWIAAHTPPEAVVLARHRAIVYHYAHRKLYWFPPISRPGVLLDGIRQRDVNYVLVVKREHSYYLPSDQDCFAPLLRTYPEAFRLVASAQKYSVYEVLPEGED